MDSSSTDDVLSGEPAVSKGISLMNLVRTGLLGSFKMSLRFCSGIS